MDKREFRKKVRSIYARYDMEYRRKASEGIMDRLEASEEFIRSSRILLYWSLPDEVYTHDFILRWSVKKEIFLPSIAGEALKIRKFSGIGALVSGEHYGIPEPEGRDYTLEDMDLVVVPGVAFDFRNGRMGRGKGYYDRLLAGKTDRTAAVGICFGYQLFEKIPIAEHDIRMDKIITDR